MLVRVRALLTDRQNQIAASLPFLTCLALVTALLYWRRPDAFYNPQLWAEDGSNFFTDAFLLGAQSLTISFAGYYHVLGRLIALIGRLAPVRFLPHWYAFAAWAFIAFTVGYIFSPRFNLPRWTKFLMGLVLVANAGDNEVFFNLANLEVLTGLVWLLLAISNEPKTRGQKIFDLILLLLLGLNSPYVIAFWLVFLIRWSTRRSAQSLWMFILSILIAIIQTINLPARMGSGGSQFQFSATIIDIIVSRFGYIFLGEQIYRALVGDLFRAFGILVVIAFYWFGLWRGYRARNWAMVTILLGSIAATFLSLSLAVLASDNLAKLITTTGRHFYIPAVTVGWSFLLADLKSFYLRWLPLALFFAAFLFFTPQSKNQVLPDLDWAGQTARCVGTQPRCEIQINPLVDPPWFAVMDSHLFAAPAIKNEFRSRFGDQIELLGYDAAQSDTVLELKLFWRAAAKNPSDYKFFAHVYRADEPAKILAQVDTMPLDSEYPTLQWRVGEFIADRVSLPVNALAPGEYLIALGWYDPRAVGLDRLSAFDSGGRRWSEDRVILPLKIRIPRVAN